MLNLYSHQKQIILEDKKKCLIAHATGAGKTMTALFLARGKTLVICPKTVRDSGSWNKQLKDSGLQLDLTVLSKEDFKKQVNDLPYFQTIIADEIHQLAGVTPSIRWRKKEAIPKASQIFESLYYFVEKTQPERFYGLSATPTRSPMVVWGIAKLLGKDFNFYEWRQAFYVRLPMPGREVWMVKNDEKSKERLGKVIRSLGYVGKLEEFVDLPEQNFKTDYIELTLEQKKKLKEIPSLFPDPLVGALKKHSVENGFLYGDEYSETEQFKCNKTDKILDYASEFDRIVIFCRYTQQIEQIKHALIKAEFNVYVLNGQTKDRGSLLNEVNNSSKYIVVVQSSISAGWEIPNAEVMIFASLDFSLVSLIQAIGRINRINNPKKNLYIYLVVDGGSVDKKVYETVVGNKMDYHLAMYN